MSKSVLISIQPKWCELIASGKKTIEVRKTKPKLETPFKVYIYCTQKGDNVFIVGDKAHKFNGKVIGEFICDEILDCRDVNMDYTCLTVDEWLKYTKGHKGAVYGWHISNLVIYDKPRELRKFIRICPEWEKEEITDKCIRCEHLYRSPIEYFVECDYEGEVPITRPPQSWCYVESEVQGE